jgi:hypothetical protein
MSPVQSVHHHLPQHRANFRIYPDGHGHWCSRKSDGMVAGTFFTREAALRFAKDEGAGRFDPPLALFSNDLSPQ